MTEMQEFEPMSEEMIMERVIGISRIVDLYGYTDPFHDTDIQKVIIEKRDIDTVTMELDMYNHSLVKDTDVYAFALMKWHDVKAISLSFLDYDATMDGLGFGYSKDGSIKTVIAPHWETSGYIISTGVEVLDLSVTRIGRV